MVKSYHRYVKHTSSIQQQAEALLAEKNNAMIASKVREDEFDLEKTYLKAKIRNLEAEIDAMAATNREGQREIKKLRQILNSYVNSDGMNFPVWDVTNEDAENNPESTSALMLSKEDAGDMARKRLREINRLDIEMNEVLRSSMKEGTRQEMIMGDIVELLENNQEVFGEGSTAHDMRQRIWLPGTKTIIETSETGVQVDEKEEFGIVTDLIELEEVAADETAEPAPSVVVLPKTPGIEHPFQLRAKMSTYPTVLRIPPAAWVCQSIMAIYMDKVEKDKEQLTRGLPRKPMCEHVYDFYLESLSMPALADAQAAQLIKACDFHMHNIRRVAIFASQVGLHDKESLPNMDTRDTTFIVSIIEYLMSLGELTTEKASRRKLTKDSIVIKSDISRASAIKTTEHLFKNWMPDGGQDYAIKVKSMNASEKGPKFVDVDEFIEILIEPWHTVRFGWEDHIWYLFDEHCLVHRILSEYQFASDTGARSKDTTLSQLNKSSAKECTRRPMRLFQRLKFQKSGEDASHKGAGNVQQKEPVCETLNRKVFINVVMLINPNITNQEADKMFDEAVEHAHRTVMRDLETIWVRCTLSSEEPDVERETQQARMGNQAPAPHVITKRPYYINLRTQLSQWTRPYYNHTFRANDIEFNSFAHVIIDHDILPRSPLSELLHMTPKDLWPNADMFLKQIKKGLI